MPDTAPHSGRIDAQIVAKEVELFVGGCADDADLLVHSFSDERVVVRLELLQLLPILIDFYFALVDEVLESRVVDDRDEKKGRAMGEKRAGGCMRMKKTGTSAGICFCSGRRRRRGLYHELHQVVFIDAISSNVSTSDT